MSESPVRPFDKSLGLWIAVILFAADAVVVAGPVERSPATIPAGEFEMGNRYCAEQRGNDDWCADEVPHRVRVDGYQIDRYEVTNADYKKCVEASACEPNELHEFRAREFTRPNQPVVFVTWDDADRYCRWRNARLPTEAEWERAAEGEDLGGAHFGQRYDQGAPRDVGTLNPNSAGLYDMMGNVYEWTQDWYGPYKTEGVQVNPAGPPDGKEKVIRGGAWNSPAHYLRPSDRVARDPALRYSDVGFRCVRPLP